MRFFHRSVQDLTDCIRLVAGRPPNHPGHKAIVWGIVISRLLNPQKPFNAPVTEGMSQRYITEPDIYKRTLILNYRNPFFPATTIPDRDLVDKNDSLYTLPRILSHSTKEWPSIKYLGEISNPATNKTTFLISIGGKDYLFRLGDSWQEVTLVRNYKDKIYLSHHDSSKYLLK